MSYSRRDESGVLKKVLYRSNEGVGVDHDIVAALGCRWVLFHGMERAQYQNQDLEENSLMHRKQVKCMEDRRDMRCSSGKCD